jgi:acyl-CoA thioester hydrolase
VDGYAFVHTEHVRFRDLDAMGHINNAVFATYVEQARIEYLASLRVLNGPVYDPGSESMILGRLEIDFRAPGAPEPDAVDIGVRPASVGRKSFTLSYRLEQGGELIAEARTVLVSYDYERGMSREVPDDWRNALERPGPVNA